jgi:hypothetical protein
LEDYLQIYSIIHYQACRNETLLSPRSENHRNIDLQAFRTGDERDMQLSQRLIRHVALLTQGGWRFPDTSL